MRYVLGIDGGQTSTTAIVGDERGVLLGIGHGGPANHIHEPGGPDRVRRSVSDALTAALERAGVSPSDLTFAYLGMTGGSTEMEALCRSVVPAREMALGHDSLIALYSVTLGGPGVAVIGGTGSVAFGRTADGRTALTGGWGYVMGDEGSGYWIAVRALAACVQAEDGIAPPTAIAGRLLERLNVASLKDVHRLVYSGELHRVDLAGLASVVGEAAADGDRVAQGVLRDAGRELGRLACGVLTRLDLAAAAVDVGTVGGVFRAGGFVLSPFRAAVLRAAPNARIVRPRIPAAAAAVLLGLEHIGVAIDLEVVRNVEASLPSLGDVKR